MPKKFQKTVRLHDRLYLKENRYERPKEIFVFLIRLLKRNYSLKEKLNVGDIGCSNGEFCYYLKKKFKNFNIIGFDVLNELIIKARRKVKNVNFFQGSILNKNLTNKNKFHISFCLGVLSIFDSFELSINNLIRWTKPKGRIYIFTFFNNYPFEVNIKFSKSENWMSGKPKFWESGYNVFSKKTISKYLKEHKSVRKFRFYDFTMKKRIKQNHNDYLRSWTIDTEKKKLIMNGTNLLHPFSILEIDLN